MTGNESGKRDLESEVTALKALTIAIIAELGNRDPEILRKIVRSLDVLRTGDGKVVFINPRFRSVQVALDNILKHFDDHVGRE